MKNKKALFDFWDENYVILVPIPHLNEKVPMCGLCGNSGRIQTNPKRSSGEELGKQEFYCLCPNGVALKEMEKK